MIADVTSKGEEPWVRFSPFWPHGGIPLPNSPGVFAKSVEGLWQGLKVFEKEDIDPSRWQITDMEGIKRGGKSRGKVLGHRFEVDSDELLGYLAARLRIYLPAYRWVLQERLVDEVERFRRAMESKTVVLLDYETNSDIEDLSKPLSHASLVKRHRRGLGQSDLRSMEDARRGKRSFREASRLALSIGPNVSLVTFASWKAAAR